jgi:cbb3-type cytochrome oxidase subunit 3
MSPQDDRSKTTDKNLHYYTKVRKDYAITAILTLVLLCLLTLPVFILYRLTLKKDMDVTYTVSIGVLLIFTLVFSAVLSMFTKAKRHEIFASAAA